MKVKLITKTSGGLEKVGMELWRGKSLYSSSNPALTAGAYSLHIASRKITGTTDESRDGVFNLVTKTEPVRLYYGDQSRCFFLTAYTDKDYPAKLKQLIFNVRAWVNSIDIEQVTVFEIPDPDELRTE